MRYIFGLLLVLSSACVTSGRTRLKAEGLVVPEGCRKAEEERGYSVACPDASAFVVMALAPDERDRMIERIAEGVARQRGSDVKREQVMCHIKDSATVCTMLEAEDKGVLVRTYLGQRTEGEEARLYICGGPVGQTWSFPAVCQNAFSVP